jgi:hypothetical protein
MSGTSFDLLRERDDQQILQHCELEMHDPTRRIGVIHVMPDRMIRMRCHALGEVPVRQTRYDASHFVCRKAHRSGTRHGGHRKTHAAFGGKPFDRRQRVMGFALFQRVMINVLLTYLVIYGKQVSLFVAGLLPRSLSLLRGSSWGGLGPPAPV